MCRVFEEVREEAAREAAEKAKREQSIKIARKMLKMGMAYEEIADMVELSVDAIKELDAKKSA